MDLVLAINKMIGYQEHQCPIENARDLACKAPYSKEVSFCHMVEEVGEIGTCLNNEVTKRKKLSEPLRNECVDVINCALELFFMDGGTIEEFYDVIEKKQGKWKQNLELLNGN